LLCEDIHSSLLIIFFFESTVTVMKNTASQMPEPVSKRAEREIKKSLHVSDMGMRISVPKVKEEIKQPIVQSL
jgi:hypothetical protein